jgi:hypothetical protein
MTILILAFIQNVSFTLVSRARNRDNHYYHIVASLFSNGIWFLTMRELVVNDLSYDLLAFYVIGTVTGSVFGAKVSIAIEKAIGAKT